MQKVSAFESFGGASSERKIAEPTPSGTAKSRARNDVMHVPYTNASAPNCPAFGSQTCVTRKCQPNFSRGSAELIQSSYTIAAVTSRISAADTVTSRRTTSSPLKNRRAKARAPDGCLSLRGTRASLCGIVVSELVICSLLNLGDRLELLCHDSLGQLRVGERLGHVLPVTQHPLHEVDERLLLGRVGDLARHEQPREARD